MSKSIFNYNGLEIIIQCNIQEKMKEIINRFILKAEANVNNLYFLYNGNIINEELTLAQIIREIDKETNSIYILVNETNKSILKEKLIKSKDIICPKCGDNILINIKDYKINLNDCKNGHKINNILFKEFESTQKIDISKIICNNCKQNNKYNSYKNEFFKCFTCNNNLCPLCKSVHDKTHKIINYEQQNYICEKHNENYIKFCNQ